MSHEPWHGKNIIMEVLENDILKEFSEESKSRQGQKFIPSWIKVFCYLFLVFGFLGVVIFFLGIFDFDFNASIYGLESNIALSTEGIIIFIIFELKGIVAYGLLSKKSWAIKLAIGDAIAGLLICFFTMFYPLIVSNGSYWGGIRLEIFLLIPYLIQMQQINKKM